MIESALLFSQDKDDWDEIFYWMKGIAAGWIEFK